MTDLLTADRLHYVLQWSGPPALDVATFLAREAGVHLLDVLAYAKHDATIPPDVQQRLSDAIEYWIRTTSEQDPRRN